MRQVINPEPIPDTTTRSTPRDYRTYRRLLALPTGWYTVQEMRRVFAVNGRHEHEVIQSTLIDMEKAGYLHATWWTEGGHVGYRMTLNPLPETVNGIDAKNEVDALAPGMVLMNRFSELQEKILGERKTPTQADHALCKRLLNDVTLANALKAVDAYWQQNAARRRKSNFRDFYYDYQKLLNEALEDEQEAKLIAREERIAARGPRTPREIAMYDLKVAQDAGDERGIREALADLEELDGEE